MINDIKSWCEEVVLMGNIDQTEDLNLSDEDFKEGEQDFDRYLELLGMVEGNEGIEVFKAIINSVQVENDYGAYQRTLNTALKFPPEVYAQGLVQTLPGLIDRNQDWAGDFLLDVAKRSASNEDNIAIPFNKYLAETETATHKKILDFIIQQEQPEGFLEDLGEILR